MIIAPVLRYLIILARWQREILEIPLLTILDVLRNGIKVLLCLLLSVKVQHPGEPPIGQHLGVKLQRRPVYLVPLISVQGSTRVDGVGPVEADPLDGPEGQRNIALGLFETDRRRDRVF